MSVSLDTNVFVSVVNKEPDSADAKKILDRIDSGSLSCVISTVVVAEICAGYHIANEIREKDDFLTHIEASQNYQVIDLSVGIADRAGKVKAETGLRLPDAVIVASAIENGVKYLISNDESLKKAAEFVRVITPEEFMEVEKSR